MKCFFAALMARLTGGVLIAFAAGALIGLAVASAQLSLISASDSLKLGTISGVALFALLNLP